jgi:hypothetical protein
MRLSPGSGSSLGEIVYRRINVMVDAHLDSAEVHTLLGNEVRRNLGLLISAGTFPPTYRRFVDGREGDPEESVKLDGGQIVYVFSRMPDAVAYTLAYCKARSPRDSGDYADAWFAAVDGVPWVGQIADIPPGSTVIITNFAPYARRLEQGYHRAHKAGHRPGLYITEYARQAVMRQFKGIMAERQFVTLSGAPGGTRGWEVPYHLRRHGKQSGERAGDAITYPAVVLTDRNA